jgi:Sigma-70, region 4
VLISRLELTPASRAAWLAVGIRDTDGLRRPAAALLELPGITGSILYETVCQLNEHHLSLPARASAARIMAATTDDLEMLRLRVVDGATLKEIGIVSKLSRERVRQRLHRQFGLTGEPPAAMERRRDRLQVQAETEQTIALRLLKREHGMPLSHLLSGFKTRASNVRARAALSRLEARGYLVVESEVVKPTAALREMTQRTLRGDVVVRGLRRAGR